MTQQQLFEMRMELTRKQVEYFIENELFTWQWWLLLALTFLPWILWLNFGKRVCQNRSLYGAFFVGLVSSIFDTIGTQLGLWKYGIKVIPSLPPLIPYDLVIMPVEYLFIQMCSKKQKRFVWIALSVAAINAFLAEPILKWINVYEPHNWQKMFSFPLYFLIFWVTAKIANDKEGRKDIC